MRIDIFTSDTGAILGREPWNKLCSLRFLDDARGALILGPLGVGKIYLATALGHVAIPRRHSVHFARADQLFDSSRPPGWTTASGPRFAA